MTLLITPIYAGLLGLLFLQLSFKAINKRTANKIGIGTGENIELLRAVRVHANFAEYTPLILLMLAFAEINGLPAASIHGMGVLLLVGRVMHALGLSKEPDIVPLRFTGMILTFLSLLGTSLACLYVGFGFLN